VIDSKVAGLKDEPILIFAVWASPHVGVASNSAAMSSDFKLRGCLMSVILPKFCMRQTSWFRAYEISLEVVNGVEKIARMMSRIYPS
jgi:hypothetical protein